MDSGQVKRGRGRPPKSGEVGATRETLVRAGVIAFSERGYSSIGLEELLGSVGVPKGSFYYYFASKEAFGLAVIEAYTAYFTRKLDLWFSDESVPPLDRIRNFAADAQAGMARYHYHRGCVIGNLAQDMGAVPEAFRERLTKVFAEWERKLSHVLSSARAQGAIGPDSDCDELAAFFWVGWEGAVLRAKLERSGRPLELFARTFLAQLCRDRQP
jgi:TetR/AcrR family transcriptional regulator, transcriptional repressor for nem operon